MFIYYISLFKLGFNIKGGTNNNPYIFVSKVYNDTIAYKCGIHEGDQVLFTYLRINHINLLIFQHILKLISVNGVDFRIIDHFEAVKLLKESTEFLIVAKFSPYGN